MDKITDIEELEQKHNEVADFDWTVYKSSYYMIHESEDEDIMLRAGEIFEEQLKYDLNGGENL